ncbi:hypothetical protein [Microbulbifer hainanensis]|uniref:hypothetical protein n=1 Tax=Microbulbifer hainanensis TaxID=2735675 RepID=UPI00186704EB|nr:hypothetical protein [Microbulbifer hainanensis]
MSERYEGKPLLRLLELYVLDAIGFLETKDESLLQQLTPKLSQTYGIEGSWKEIIQNVMELPENMQSLIRDLWLKNQEIAKQNNTELQAEHFAMMFVDQNLS